MSGKLLGLRLTSVAAEVADGCIATAHQRKIWRRTHRADLPGSFAPVGAAQVSGHIAFTVIEWNSFLEQSGALAVTQQ